MRTQAEFTYIAHNMFGQIKMEIPWYINRQSFLRHTGKPSSGVHQTFHPKRKLRSETHFPH
jgi:hypothetical protein